MADEPQRGKRKSPAQHKKLASLLAQEVPLGEALRQAGWSERQSMKGWASVPDQVYIKLPKKAQRLSLSVRPTKRPGSIWCVGASWKM